MPELHRQQIEGLSQEAIESGAIPGEAEAIDSSCGILAPQTKRLFKIDQAEAHAKVIALASGDELLDHVGIGFTRGSIIVNVGIKIRGDHRRFPRQSVPVFNAFEMVAPTGFDTFCNVEVRGIVRAA